LLVSDSESVSLKKRKKDIKKESRNECTNKTERQTKNERDREKERMYRQERKTDKERKTERKSFQPLCTFLFKLLFVGLCHKTFYSRNLHLSATSQRVEQ
jgi:hypothetical protein